MRKKIISIVLVAVMLISMACVGVVSSSAASDTLGKIYFQMPQAWIDIAGGARINVYAHIWVNGGEEYFTWQEAAEIMTAEGNNLYSFDITRLPAVTDDGTQPQWNMVIFSFQGRGIDGQQTFDTTLYPECIGKTFTVNTDIFLENPMDSNKKGSPAYCEGTPAGPKLVLSSLGNVVPDPATDGCTGSLLPGETVDDILANYISAQVAAFENANPNATDDEIAAARAEAEAAAEELRPKVEAALPEEVPTETEPSETTPSETTPVETDPSESTPVETDPSETAPVETEPSETTPVETDPTETLPVETDPTETTPIETDPSETTPAETDPSSTEPTDETVSTTDEYGRYRGIPTPEGMIVNETAETNPDLPDWDGYYKIYYFLDTEDWATNNAEYKDEGFEIGFYWYKGEESIGAWPGEPASNLADFKVEYYKEMHPDATDEEIAQFTAEAEAQFGNVYYALCRSDVPFIMWNNGVNAGLPTDDDYTAEKDEAALQTQDINVEDPFYNVLGSKYEISDDIYNGEDYYANPEYNGDYATGAPDLCGSISYVTGYEETVNSFTGLTKRVANVNWKYYEPKEGLMTNQGLVDEAGELILDAEGYAQNPYYDLDYSYIPPEGTPIERPDAEGTTLPEETTAPTTNAQPGSSTTATTPSGSTPKGVVNTAESSAVLAIVAVLAAAGLGVFAFSRRRRDAE